MKKGIKLFMIMSFLITGGVALQSCGTSKKTNKYSCPNRI